MNIKGSLTRLENIIILEGLSVGGVERRLPSAEKQKAPRAISITKINGFAIFAPKANMQIDRGTIDMTAPKRKPERISPRMMEAIEAGVEIRRSSVRIRVSQGAMRGLADEAVKKSVIPTSPGRSTSTGIFLPIAKAKNNARGKRSPNIKTGAFR